MDVEAEEIRRLRCRLCFHAGENFQLVEVFSKSHDLSKRVISALGVKINRSEKQARICTVCETIVDIIQSFQAVCKQTNQLHHDRSDFLLYDKFWDSREQDAVKLTERMILMHRSEVDRTFSRTIPIAVSSTSRQESTNVVPIVEKTEIVEAPVELKSEMPVKEEPAESIKKENVQTEIVKTEVVVCEPSVKYETHEPGSDSQIQFHPEIDEPIPSDGGEFSAGDSDFKPEDDISSEAEDINVKPKRGRRKRNRSPSVDKDVDGDQKPRKGRKKKVASDNEQSDEEFEAKPAGKRGPRRKKIRKSDPSVCEICGQTVAHFVKESHHNQHLGVRPYKCDFEGCGRSYFSQNDLRTHSKRHQITYHVCEICGRNIKGVEWFRRHVKTHTEGPQFTCEVCGSKFRRKAQLQTHMVTHTGLTPHECEICGKRFALKYNLEAHVKRHQKKDGTEKVQEPKKASEKRTWKYYVKAGNSDKKHHVTCETCGSSVHKREIEGHVNKHLGRRPYSCDEPGCTLAFYGVRGIKEHKMVVHSDKVLRYECSICNRSIKGAGTFKRHVMMHNSDMKVECQHCGKKFTSKSYLKAHEQKHTGERPYVCELCGRSFAMKPCWKMHMKTVHNEDRREPTRVRKRTPDGQMEHQPEQQLPPDGEILLPKSSSPPTNTMPLNAEIIADNHQQYHHQQQHLALPQQPHQLQQQQQQQVQPSLHTSIVGPEVPHYPTPQSVQTDYSY